MFGLKGLYNWILSILNGLVGLAGAINYLTNSIKGMDYENQKLQKEIDLRNQIIKHLIRSYIPYNESSEGLEGEEIEIGVMLLASKKDLIQSSSLNLDIDYNASLISYEVILTTFNTRSWKAPLGLQTHPEAVRLAQGVDMPWPTVRLYG